MQRRQLRDRRESEERVFGTQREPRNNLYPVQDIRRHSPTGACTAARKDWPTSAESTSTSLSAPQVILDLITR